MSAQLNSGIRALHLVIPTPYDLSRTTDVRDDLIAVKVWYSTTSGFNPRLGQGTLFSETNSLSVTITGLETNKIYYVKYALISDIDPTHYTISKEYSAMTYDENTSLYGYLTNDPTGLSTASDGSGGNWAVTQGTFKLFSYSEDVTGKNDFTNGPFYSIKPNSTIGGLVATIDSHTGVYSASAMTGNSGSVVYRAVYKNMTVEKVWNVYKGPAGQTAPTIQLTTPIKEFIYKDVNQKRSTTASTTITATLKNLTGTPTWSTRAFSREGVELGAQFGDQQIAYTTSTNGLSITITNDQFSNPLDNNVDLGYVVVKARIGEVAFDELSIYRICDGSTQIQVEQSNQAHQITADENGGTDSLNYVGSGTTFTVKKGAQTLAVDNTGTDGFSADTWRIINIDDTHGITRGTTNIGSTFIEYGNASAMTADVAYIDYTVRVQITDSTHQDFVQRQSFSKSKQGVRGNTAKAVNLTYDKLGFLTDNSTNPPTITPSNFITFTATASNYTGGATYTWLVDGIAPTTSVGITEGNVFKLKPFPVGEARLVKVTVSENAVTSFDDQSVVSILVGSDGYSALIGNQNRNIVCDSTGAPEQGQFPITATFFVYKGAVPATGVIFEKISYNGGNDASYDINRTSGVITINSSSITSSEAVFKATASGFTVTKSLFLNKTKDGKTPIKGTDYNDGTSVVVQYSLNASQWHDNYIQGDVFIRIGSKYPNGSIDWSPAQKYIPEKGIEYFDGKSSYLHIKYSNDVTATTVGGVTTYTANSFTSSNGETPGDFMGTYTDENPSDSNNKDLYTWVRIKGEEGPKGPRNASGFLYYQVSGTSPPGAPTITDAIKASWNWTTGTFGTYPSSWNTTPFTPNAGEKAYAISYYVSESAFGVTPVAVSLGTVTTSITFDGLVTFTNLNGKANTSDLNNKVSVGGAATDINNYRNTTKVLGGAIEAGTIDANALYIGKLDRTGDRLEITNSTIKVFSAVGGGNADRVRVIIGNLAA